MKLLLPTSAQTFVDLDQRQLLVQAGLYPAKFGREVIRIVGEDFRDSSWLRCIADATDGQKLLVDSARDVTVRTPPMLLNEAPNMVSLLNGDMRVDMKRVKARKDEVSGRSNRGVEGWLRGLNNCTVIQGHVAFSHLARSSSTISYSKPIEFSSTLGDEHPLPGFGELRSLHFSPLLDDGCRFSARASGYRRRRICWAGIRPNVSSLRKLSRHCRNGFAIGCAER